MPGLSGLALTKEETIEILSLYATSAARVDAVASAPGWIVVGSFPMPATADIRLDALGSVSDPGLTMSIRLYCTTVGSVGVVGGSLMTLSSLVDVHVFSSVFNLVGNRSYQVQCQVVGAAGSPYFGNLRRVAPAGI